MAYEKGIDNPANGSALCVCAVLSVIVFAASSGCVNFGRRPRNLAEVQLREQRATNSELREQLEATQAELAQTQQKIKALRKTQSSAEVTHASVSALSPNSVERLELSSLLSGGLDRDGVPGDELLSVLASPVDKAGHAVRVDGTLAITAFDYTLPAEDQRVGRWEWNTDATSALWSEGVIGTGYRVTEPWQKQPLSKRVVLHARFVTTEGQQVDATQTVTIELPARETSEHALSHGATQ